MEKSQRHNQLETILVLVTALVILYRLKGWPFLLPAAIILSAVGLFIRPAARAIHWLWMKLAEGMGYVMSRVILTIIFIIIVIPLGWLSRKKGKSSIKLKAGTASFFRERNHLFTKEDMENLW